MVVKQQLADQLKAQSDIWRAQVKDYQERLEQMGEQARSEYKKTMEQMQANGRGSDTIWLSYDLDPFHGPAFTATARNFLYLDGHVQ